MRAVVSVIGKDMVGILAKVSAEGKYNAGRFCGSYGECGKTEWIDHSCHA